MKTLQHPNGRTIKFGRTRPIFGPRMHLKRYLRTFKSINAPDCDYSKAAMPALSDIFGNDELGDCVVAGGYHVEGVATGNAGDLFHATSEQIVKDYSAIGGYVPGNPATDQGCDEETALNYWTTHGFANGTKLFGWLAVDPTDVDEVRTALYLFENLFFGVELPDEWISPFPTGQFVWGVGTPDPENGHCFIGDRSTGTGIGIDTWGETDGIVTYEAIAELCTRKAGGGLYVLGTPDQLAKGQAKAPNGLLWSDLMADWATLGPSSPAPAPTPAPAPSTVSLAFVENIVKQALQKSRESRITLATAKTRIFRELRAQWPIT